MVKKTLKNILKVEVPFYKIKPGQTATVEFESLDDIHYRGIELGHLIVVGEEKVEEKIIKGKEIITGKIVTATSKFIKKKVR